MCLKNDYDAGAIMASLADITKKDSYEDYAQD
jgi:hypothetical protein